MNFIKTEKFKTTVICILLRRNLKRDEVTKNSLIANILKNGCEKYPTIKDINNKTELMYGSIFDLQIIKKGEEQIFQFYLEFINNNETKNLLNEGFEFLHELIYKPLTNNNRFDTNFFEIEKNNLKESIESRINNKSEYSKNRCFEEMCKNEPFGIFGDGYIEDIENIENENLLAHYFDILKSSQLEIIVMGNHDKNNVQSTIDKHFKTYSDTNNILPTQLFDKKDINYFTEKIQTSQSKICMGLRCELDSLEEDLYKLIVLNEILGGSGTSILFTKIREKENLCYYINSYVYRFKSIIFIECGVDDKDIEKTTELIVNEIENIKKCNFDEKILLNVKNNLIRNYNSIEDSQSSTIDFYMSQYLSNNKNKISDVINIIENIKKEDLLKIAKNIYIDTIYMLRNI